jgi:CubicO group peptidase (beta-lactamase class C family)
MLGRIAVALLALVAQQVSAQGRPIECQIDAYLRPYVDSGNFSGAVLVQRHGRTVFHKAYGLSDEEHRVHNSKATRFHIASVSMQFTAAAVLRLVDQGLLTLNTPIGEFIPGVVGGEKITVRDLLVERSGLPDINNLSNYDDILQHHQTPASLVAKIEGHPLLFEPGSTFLHEEHSAYNLLALIVEKKTGLPFASALERLVFHPAGLAASGVDDDSIAPDKKMAIGYEPQGVTGLKRARSIHWSAKTGNASVYATVAAEAKWVETLFLGHLLKAASRQAVLDTSPRVGYGWFRGESKRFNETAYYMNGRAPGFASFVLYLPNERMTVVAFSNIYSSATTGIGNDIAAIALGLPYTPFHPSTQLPAAIAAKCSSRFRFGSDFYQPNAQILLVANRTDWSLRWPSDELSPLIPLGGDRFVDRAYWEDVEIERDGAGCPSVLGYGHFRGSVVVSEVQ